MKRSTVPSPVEGLPSPGRRHALAVLGALAAVGAGTPAWGAGPVADAGANATVIEVYKSPYCGCCSQWVKHIEANGFKVTVRDVADLTPVKAAYAVPAKLHACHTALVDGYVVEGHVPADLIHRLLAERPDVAGIAVPGMPSSSPGMDMPTGEEYDVLLFDKDGRTEVYARR